MRKFLLLLGLLACQGLWGQINSKAILSKIDAQVSFMETDLTVKIEMTQTKPGEGISQRTFYLFRRDRENKYLILFEKPDLVKGKGYITIGNNLLLYETNPRRYSVTSAKDRFENSGARNSDFTHSTFAKDFKIVRMSTDKLGPFNTNVLELEALHNGVAFPKVKLWVTEDNLVRKAEDYSLSGQLLRTTYTPQYLKFAGHSVPKRVKIEDALLGKTINNVFEHETTEYSIVYEDDKSNPDPKLEPVLSTAPLDPLTFTQAYLESHSK